MNVCCPECDSNFSLKEDTILGELVSCTDCNVDLEVISLKPITVELAPEEDEDWGE